MKSLRTPIQKFAALRRCGAIHCAMACSLVLAVTFGAVSLEYWSGRTYRFIFDTWQGMTVESYRNLALVTALLGWLVSQAPDRGETRHRRPFRP